MAKPKPAEWLWALIESELPGRSARPEEAIRPYWIVPYWRASDCAQDGNSLGRLAQLYGTWLGQALLVVTLARWASNRSLGQDGPGVAGSAARNRPD